VRMPTKVRYAVRAAVELAGREAGGPVPVKVLADAQGISPKYAKQLMHELRRAGIVKGFPGLNGGFRLARRPSEISVLDIYTAMAGMVHLVPCVTCGGQGDPCRRREICSAADFWQALSDSLEMRMGSATIEQLARRGRSLARARRRAVEAAASSSPRGRE